MDCVKQQLEKLIDLQVKLCASNHGQGIASFSNGFLWTEIVTNELLAQILQKEQVFHIFRPLPENVDMMSNNEFQYKFRHTHHDCPNNVTLCTYPHSRGEDTQWNQWKKEGETPVKLHDSAMAEYEKCELYTN